MRDIPLDVLFTFPTPNYVNPVTRGPALIIINAVLLTLCTFFMILRLYTRLGIKRTFGWDDASLVIGYIFAVGLATDVLLANNRFYWDRHVWDVPLNAIHHLGKSAMAAKELFTVAVTFIRMALLLFYYRLVGDTGLRHFKWALHFTMALNLAVLIAFTFLTIFQCTPISAYWTFGMSYKCLDEGVTTLVSGIINCVVDLLVTALPIPIVMRLQMPLPQRIGVAFLLSLGFIVTIAGVVRTYFIWKALIDSYDQTWYAYPLWISAAIEVELAVITACIPPLRPLFALYLPGFANPITRITDRISSGRSHSSKQHSKLHSANTTQPLSQTTGKTLDSSLDSTLDEHYKLDPEKFQQLEISPASADSPNPAQRTNWHIFRRQSIEVKRDTIPARQNASPMPQWPQTNGLLDGQDQHQDSRSRGVSAVFTRWLGSNTDPSSTSGTSTHDEATARLNQHPFRNDDSQVPSPRSPPNFSKPYPLYSTNTFSPESTRWPLQDHEAARVSHTSPPSRADEQVHRVEITHNPFREQRQEYEMQLRNKQLRLPPTNNGGDSRATSMTDHWA